MATVSFGMALLPRYGFLSDSSDFLMNSSGGTFFMFIEMRSKWILPTVFRNDLRSGMLTMPMIASWSMMPKARTQVFSSSDLMSSVPGNMYTTLSFDRCLAPALLFEPVAEFVRDFDGCFGSKSRLLVVDELSYQ